MRSIEELEKMSKPLSELIYEEEFIVKNVLSESKMMKECLEPPRMGEIMELTETGMSTVTTLEVEPINEIPVNELVFRGVSLVKKGDRIYATIPRIEEIRIGEGYQMNLSGLDSSVYYLDREYKKSEEPIELKILFHGKEGVHFLRTDRSVDYNDYR